MMNSNEKITEFNKLYPTGNAGLSISEHLALMSICCLLYRTVKEKMPLKDPIETIQMLAKLGQDDHKQILETYLILSGAFLNYDSVGDINNYGCSTPGEMIDAIKQLINKTLPF